MLTPIELKAITDKESGRRVYINEVGLKAPSVTTILGQTADRSFLNKWNQDNPGAREEAADRGQAVHTAIENFLKYKTLTEVTSIAAPYFQHVKPFLNTIIPLFLELPIFSNLHGFAGRIDCGAIVCGDTPVIIDWKTSAKKKYNWYDYPLQLAAYLHGFKESYPLFEIDFTQTLIVCVTPETLQLKAFTPEEVENNWHSFLSRLAIYKEQNAV